MRLRRLLPALAAAALLTASATPASAIVGGRDASPGEYPSVAEVTFGAPGVGIFGCTGTLIAPTWVLTAGHCGSLTGVAVSTPVAWPPQSFNVWVGGHKPRQGEKVKVKSITVHPDYLLSDGYDIALLELSAPATSSPTSVAGAPLRSIWLPGTLATIAGWGLTEEDGDEGPDTLQEAEVPIITDALCAQKYEAAGYEIDETMVCAGYDKGGVDTCQGDSGGPLFARDAFNRFRVVGATSFGIGCARAEYPGVYARVADTPLRTWIASTAGPAAIATDGAPAGQKGSRKPKSRKAKRAKRRA